MFDFLLLSKHYCEHQKYFEIFLTTFRQLIYSNEIKFFRNFKIYAWYLISCKFMLFKFIYDVLENIQDFFPYYISISSRFILQGLK